jgi:hypothetical protein
MHCLTGGKMAKIKCKLKDHFPTEKLSELSLGSADGHRDKLIERGFIKTYSIKTFLMDQHSIIIGPFGSGKSALFRLMKIKSDHLDKFNNDLIVAIEEQVQFTELRSLCSLIFSSLDERLAYQLVWKFQITRRIAEELAKEQDFPNTENEKYISEFLKRSGGVGGQFSIVSKLKNLFESVSFKIKASLSKTPVGIEIGKEAGKSLKRVEINLDEVLDKLKDSISSWGFRRCTVIIDKIDKFVSGEDYDTQRLYIESLLEIEDDFYANPSIRFKIFLREDLYKRLNLTSIGPDKAGDNTLKLKWGPEEIKSFIAARLYLSLFNAEIWEITDIIQSTDMSEFSLGWHEKVLRYSQRGGLLYKAARFYKQNFGKKRPQVSLFEKLNRTIINKLFENQLVHINEFGKDEEIECYDFFDTHFLDGNNSCTPRYILIFLKKLIEESNNHYSNSPNIQVYAKLNESGWKWDLFTAELVYTAYSLAKEEYINHVVKVDNKWTQSLLEFMDKKKSKVNFDYSWIKQNISVDGDVQKLYEFVIFLQVIGILKTKEYKRDIKTRKYTLPILYRKPT